MIFHTSFLQVFLFSLTQLCEGMLYPPTAKPYLPALEFISLAHDHLTNETSLVASSGTATILMLPKNLQPASLYLT